MRNLQPTRFAIPAFLLACTLSCAAPNPLPTAPAGAKPLLKSKAEPSVAPAAPKATKAAATPKRNPSITAVIPPSPVSQTGALKLADLIAAALHNGPDVVKRRSEVEVAFWAKEAAKDWEDPELRISYGTQTGISPGDAYTETGTSMGSFAGSGSSLSSETATNFSRYDAERTNFSESRYRTFERTVTPGATRDKIVVTEYEERNSDSSGTKHRDEHDVSGGGVRRHTLRDSVLGDSSQRRVLGRTTTYQKHGDVTEADDEWGGLIRFKIPNFWERSARIKQAEAGIEEADWELRAAIQDTTLKVKALYDKLVFLELSGKSSEALAKVRRLNAQATRDNTAKNTESATKANFDSLDAKFKAETIRFELAQLTGLKDLKRIEVPNTMPLRRININALDSAYLLEMSSNLNPAYQLLRHKWNAAAAKAGEESAKRIPMPGFFDLGMSQRDGAGGKDRTDVFARVGISIPLFSNTINRSLDAARAEARAYSQQQGQMSTIIEATIDSAIAGLKIAEEGLVQLEVDVKQANIFVAQNLGKNFLEEVNDKQELTATQQAQKLEYHAMYNTALLRLEAALGAPLDLVLKRNGSK